jgi:tetratricopeptide (TPR) repeat protein
MAPPIEEAKQLRKCGKHAEALAVLDAFLLIEPENADAWWHAGLAFHSLKKHEKAAEYLRKTLKLAPRWAPGWSQLGVVLCEIGNIAEGEKALFHSLRLKPDDQFALRQLARFARQEKNYDRELNYLLELYSIGEADSHDLNQIGIAAYNQKDFSRAIEFYHLSIAANPSPAPLYNLALIYNDPDVSQDVDATDCLRRALMLDSAYKLGKDKLGKIAEKLEGLADKALAAGRLLSEEEWFRFYINPFEILDADPSSDLCSIDAKWIQFAKKQVKSELQLEEGRLEVLGNVQMDQNRILECIDELFDEDKKVFHWNVFQTPPLLNFLTRGHIEHFLYFPDYFPREALNALDWEDFRRWLSEPFSHQFDFVLGRALERESFPQIEALFDGRRWIVEKGEEICFSGARRYIARRLEPLDHLVEKAVEDFPPILEIESLIDGHHVIDYAPRTGTLAQLLNLLPDQFRDLQSRAVESLRTLALAAYNNHGDADLSKAILNLSKKFHFKSPRLRHQLEDDFKKIEQLIKQEREHEAKFSLGERPMEVTKDGVKHGDTFLKASEIAGIRWGITVTTEGYARHLDFLLIFRDTNLNSVKISWKTSQNLEKQQDAFNSLLKASLIYIVPSLVARIQHQIENGEHIRVGTCNLRKDGITFETQGWFTTKQRFIPWGRIGTEIESGMLHVFDKGDRSVKVICPLRDSENAVVLQFLANNPR